MKFIISALEEVPEAIRSEYELKDGKYLAKVEGDVPGYAPAAQLAEANGKVVQFRDSYTSLLKEVAAIAGVSEAKDLSPIKAKLATYEGIDPDKYKTLEAKVADFEKKGVKKPDDIQTQIKAAIADYHKTGVEPLQKQLVEEKEARVEAQGRANDALFRQSIGDRYLKAGGKATALDFIVAQAKQSFRVVENEVKAYDTKFSPLNPTKPLEIDEWVSQATKEYDFAFESSKGGDAGGSGAGGGTNTRPGVREIASNSLTPQELGRMSKDIAEGKVRIVD